ncbi:MAG: RagB/SusD family nutrient uptake outer membrane protein [Alistipes sp.]|uniref:RagB/SusD family nutrient uptake outer membrane protein n=2 Tax=Alistipes TaxID=239759 RepID=A0ABY5V7C0_9BACT|nr:MULTISPECIES: RagB/SusD family nutrient uptake outer membrane protein [Alistipes]MBD9302088.1 RagB/SusD family nutrient uptake outer membrane protein [Alistipes senegalensis]MBR2219232.1 RagB/SusD family nutrient uptake outer membrane protein [Alistipes sp.]MBS5524960.1 RagB/SusD family nutrient uptake outer membrane protein [Alistipes sp.]UEA86880.1 RagB/SusD family nutrient uptake outer membrane protein [Alistipes senegalensis]UWN65530.1 RagB/SusD family nutrient uptake outer membrane pro
MKIIRYVGAVLLAAFAGQGCSLLDTTPDGRETLDQIFADHDKTAAYLNTCYSKLPTKGTSYYWVCNAPTALSDEGYLVSGTINDAIPAKMYTSGGTASSHPVRDYSDDENYYSAYMLQLRYCTTFLQYIDKAGVNSESERARWRAEAHVLRAYYMLEMLKWFGAFAYEPNGYPDDYDYSTLKKRTVWELAELIDAECTAAIDTNELPWRIDNPSDVKRMTKALAWCIKSKAYLFAASPVHSEDYSADQKASHWKTAFQVNQQAVEALESNGYSLKTSVSNPRLYTGKAAAYKELFTSISLTSADDRETIYQATSRQNYIDHNYIGALNWPNNTTRAGVVPTQEMVDAYEVLNADGTVAEPLLDLANPYTATKTPNYNQKALDLGYDPDDPYAAPRDPRMEACIIRNGDKILWGGELRTVETFVGGENGVSDDTSENRFTRTGYYYRKYIAPDVDATDNKVDAAPWKFFRLAEIKLNLAEAAAEAGELDVAKAQVNDIRSRVGMPALPDDLTQAEMILRVRHERMVELCYEECRYFDVRRWAEAFAGSQLYQQYFKIPCERLTVMWITKNPDDTYTYERRTDLLRNASTQPRDVLLPIPETEANNLYSLTNKRWQNSGW